jgi:hypothetical protein
MTSTKLYVRRQLLRLLAVLVLCSLTSCGGREEAIALADAGIETATSLAQFYEALAQKVTETYKGQVYLGVLRGAPVNEDTLRGARSVTRSLKLRAKAARDLAALYGSLKKLSSYNASEEVQNEATGLVKDLLSLPGLNPLVDPSSIASKILGGVAGEKQSRDIRRAVNLAYQILQTIQGVFQAESAVKDANGDPVLTATDEDGNPLPVGQQGQQLNLYANVVLARNLVTANVIEELIRSKAVVGWPILENYPQTLGLPFSDLGKKAIECPPKTANNTPEETRKIAECEGVIAVLKSQMRGERLSAGSASDNLLEALRELSKAHNDLLHKQGISLKQWQFFLNEAQSYVDELQKLKNGAAPGSEGGN